MHSDGKFGIRFIWNYHGHNGGKFLNIGPNWYQITFPRKNRRCCIIIWRKWRYA